MVNFPGPPNCPCARAWASDRRCGEAGTVDWRLRPSSAGCRAIQCCLGLMSRLSCQERSAPRVPASLRTTARLSLVHMLRTGDGEAGHPVLPARSARLFQGLAKVPLEGGGRAASDVAKSSALRKCTSTACQASWALGPARRFFTKRVWATKMGPMGSVSDTYSPMQASKSGSETPKKYRDARNPQPFWKIPSPLYIGSGMGRDRPRRRPGPMPAIYNICANGSPTVPLKKLRKTGEKMGCELPSSS